VSDTQARIEITASSNRLAAGLRRAQGMVAGFSRGVGASMKAIGSSSAASFVGNFGAGLAGRGMDYVSDQAKKVVAFESSMTRFGIAAGQGRAELNELGKTLRQASVATGINANEIAAAAGVYFDLTSDAKGTATAMQSFARIAAASGASMEDVVRTGAAMSDSLGITADQMEGVFGSLIAQGKAGKIGLKDMAAELTNLAPKFSRFKNALGPRGMVALGAAFQVAAKGFGTSSEAATGLEALMGSLSQHAKKFEKAGVKIFDVDKKTGVKTFRDLHEIVVAIGNSKLAKDPTALTDAFGRKEAEAAFFQLNRLRGMYDEVSRAGSEGAQTVGQDFKTWIESPAGKIERSMERLKNRVAEALTPERIEAFGNALEHGVDMAAKLIDKIETFGGRLGKFFGVGEKAFFDQIEERGGAEGVFAEARSKQHLQVAGGFNASERSKYADQLDERAKALEGYSGMDPERRSLQIAADQLRRQDDAWSARGGRFNPATFGIAAAKFGANPSAAATEGIDAIKTALPVAIREAFGDLVTQIQQTNRELARISQNTAARTEVKIDNDAVARANKRSTRPRSG